MGISLPTSGKMAVLPTRWVYRLSLGLTAMPVSPSMVSGRVVAHTTTSSLSLTLYSMCHSLPAFSVYSTSTSDRAVLQLGHQLMMRLPW